MPVDSIINQTNVEARPYQSRIVNKVVDMLMGNFRSGDGAIEDAVKSVMIESPTGSGKSCMGLLAAKAMQVQTGARIGWCAMRRNLLTQVQAENRDLGINVDLQTISMFDKNPPAEIDLLVVDECVPGDTLLDVIENGQRRQVRMDDVVERNVGNSVLSCSESGQMEFQPITSRTPMGRKELIEVTMIAEGEERVLLITEEGRVWTESGYKRPLELSRDTILCKASRCQTYLYGQRATATAEQVPTTSRREESERASLCMRMRREGALVPASEEVQDVPLQSPSSSIEHNINRDTTAGYSWDACGRRVRKLRLQPSHQGANECPATNSPLDNAATGLCGMEAQTAATAKQSVTDSGEPGLRERGCRIQHSVAPVHNEGSQPTLYTEEINLSGISRPTVTPGVRSVVDGRRCNQVTVDTCVHTSAERSDCRMAAGSMGIGRDNLVRRTGAKELSDVSTTECCGVAEDRCTARDQAALVQVREIPADAVVRGTVIRVRHTGQHVETYDIGVANNHNFFADGILIHNCQHDAASSMAHIHSAINPRWVLGLTATPFRADRANLCFDRIIRDTGIHSLIADDYLSEFDHFTIPNWNPEDLAEFYCSDSERWGKSIFFFHTLNDCYGLQELLLRKGIRSEVVTGSSDKDNQLAAFQRGEVDVVINAMILTEGFNCPAVKTVWIRPSMRGPTIQMAGRALRKFAGLPVKQIVQCKQTPWPFVKTAPCRQQYLWQAGGWRSLQPNPLLNLANTNARRAVATSNIQLPAFLKKSQQKRQRPLRF